MSSSSDLPATSEPAIVLIPNSEAVAKKIRYAIILLMPKLKIYLDTSVISAYYDDRQPERMKLTQNFWKQIRNYEIFVSSIVVAEIDKWDDPIRLKLKKLIKNLNILSVDNKNVIKLTKKYIREKIIPASQELDATHIAVAAVSNINTILSWNFKHMVRKKVKLGVNYINNLLGYDSIEIMTPAEFS